jgi:hypothetical protein
MKNLLLAAAAATFVIAAAPAFAGHSDDVHDWWGQSPAATCHFVREPVRMSNGHVVYEEVEVCS